MRNVIVVTGTPGTGKTTFAVRMAREIEADYISLSQFAADHRLYVGFDRGRRSKIIDVPRVCFRLKTLLLSSAGRQVVVDTHIPEGIVSKMVARQVFVLRCHPRILEARLRAKGWKPSEVRENVQAELLDSCLIASVEYYGWQRLVQLDTSHMSPRRLLDRAKRILAYRSPARMIKVDWIATLAREGLLDKYLK